MKFFVGQMQDPIIGDKMKGKNNKVNEVIDELVAAQINKQIADQHVIKGKRKNIQCENRFARSCEVFFSFVSFLGFVIQLTDSVEKSDAGKSRKVSHIIKVFQPSRQMSLFGYFLIMGQLRDQVQEDVSNRAAGYKRH